MRKSFYEHKSVSKFIYNTNNNFHCHKQAWMCHHFYYIWKRKSRRFFDKRFLRVVRVRWLRVEREKAYFCFCSFLWLSLIINCIVACYFTIWLDAEVNVNEVVSIVVEMSERQSPHEKINEHKKEKMNRTRRMKFYALVLFAFKSIFVIKVIFVLLLQSI